MFVNDHFINTIRWLWENFDGNDSVFYDAVFNDNADLKGNQLFMTLNLINGFWRPLEKLHKNGFASAVILGDKDNQELHMLWLFKGQGLPEDITQAELGIPFAERFTMTKLDHNDEKTRKDINDYLLWSSEIKGKTFLDGKIFK